MRFILTPYIALPLAAVFLIAAALIWYVLVRPVPEKTATGVIIGKQFQPAENVERSVPRTTRGLDRYPQVIKYNLPDRYLLDIRIDQVNTVVQFAYPALPNQNYEIGQHVNVTYLERGIPHLWKRIYVKDISLQR